MAKDPYKYFRIEARELSEELAKGAIYLEKSEQSAPTIAALLRAAHTLKGAARVVKQTKIADLAHAIEDQLGPQREASGTVPKECVSALLGFVDAISAELGKLEGVPQANAAAIPALELVTPREPQEELFRGVRADVAEVDVLVDAARETKSRVAALRRSAAPLEQARHMTDVLSRELSAPGRDSNKLLEHTRGSLRELSELLSNLERSLTRGLDQAHTEVDTLQESAEKLRLVPAHVLLDALERITRDAAQLLTKQVTFEAHGGDVRLDGHLLSVVQNALVQVARNALAHGIESPDERVRASKSPEGRFSVRIERHAGRVTFTCHDDGRGVDLEAIRRAAERSGMSTSESRELGSDALFARLLKGGISTSSRVTEVSGRGVGLDVVRDAAKRLGGQVSMRTVRGQGTTIELGVPLTLSSMDAVVVEGAELRCAIPLESVRGALRITRGDLIAVSSGDAINYAGKVIPFMPLERALGFSDRDQSVGSWSALVVESASQLAAVGVTRLVGTSNIILRSLPALAPANSVVAGSTLDTEGTPELVLDPEGLVRRVSRHETVSVAPEAAAQRVLVVDDSPTTRMLEQSILESAGYMVDLATSAEEGLVKAQEKPYALFLVDVEMPGMDGFDFIKNIRSDANLKTVPAILVTSRDAPEDRKRGFDAGAQGYVIKGEFDQSKLLDQIGRLLV